MTSVRLKRSRTPTKYSVYLYKDCGVEVVDKCWLSLVALKQEGTERVLPIVNQSDAEVESYSRRRCVIVNTFLDFLLQLASLWEAFQLFTVICVQCRMKWSQQKEYTRQHKKTAFSYYPQSNGICLLWRQIRRNNRIQLKCHFRQ